jgi:hypothetical protein
MVDPTAFKPDRADDLNQAAPVPAAMSPVIAPVSTCSGNNRWAGARYWIETINRQSGFGITGAEKFRLQKQVKQVRERPIPPKEPDGSPESAGVEDNVYLYSGK